MVIKLKTILFAACSVLVVTLLCLGLSFSGAAALVVPKQNKLIVIDAGHGGIDGGVVGKKTGIKESEINLAIARMLEKNLKAKGYDVVMTRTTTDGLYGMSDKNKKRSDMLARKVIINSARPDLVVSIHQNSYPLSYVSGAQVFFDKSSETSKSYAEKTQHVLNTALSGTREAKVGDYFILKCTESPSILVECGFLSNEQEEKLLVSGAYQDKVAYSLASAIYFLLNTDDKNA